MRCFCCDKELSDYEAVLKSFTTNHYLDMCSYCILDSGIDVPIHTVIPKEVYDLNYEDI